MELKIMLCGALVLGGFLWSYLFVRQFLFNIFVAHPLIRRMNLLQEDLIGKGASRYTLISDIVSLVVGLALLALVVYLCRNNVYMIICFGVGAIAAIVFILLRTKPENKESFDLFASAYYRFVPDDELRTILYNKEYKKVKSRLKDMGIEESFLPKFKT